MPGKQNYRHTASSPFPTFCADGDDIAELWRDEVLTTLCCPCGGKVAAPNIVEEGRLALQGETRGVRVEEDTANETEGAASEYGVSGEAAGGT